VRASVGILSEHSIKAFRPQTPGRAGAGREQVEKGSGNTEGKEENGREGKGREEKGVGL